VHSCNRICIYRVNQVAHYITLKYRRNILSHNNSANASHTKLYIPTIFHRLSLPLWPNFLLTQFLTNHGSFRSHLHKINKTPSPNCNCPEKTVQTAHHLILECSLWSKDRRSVLKSLPPPLVLQYHINTVSITSFLRRIFQALQEDAQVT